MTTLTDDEFQAQLAQMRETWQQMWVKLAEAMVPIEQAIRRLWSRIVAWIHEQGILSPALAYATPAMRRRAARDRARLATQAKQRRRRIHHRP